MIEKNRDKLDLLSKKLEEEEVLEAEQILELLNIKEEKKKSTKKEDSSGANQEAHKSENYNPANKSSGSEKLA